MRGKDLYEKITDIDDDIISEIESPKKGRRVHRRWIGLVALFFLIVAPALALHSRNMTDKRSAPFEIEVELNNKFYSVVYTKQSPAYEKYNLEKNITPELLGEYLGETTVKIDKEGNKDTFKLYKYSKAPQTQYDWYPRIVVESSDGSYYHALIGSVFNDKYQTAIEVLTVYGLLSADDIVGIENEKGKEITSREFIEKFYNGIFTKEYGDNDFLQENVYQNTGVNESKINKLYHKHADDMVYLKVELANGLIIGVDFTSHNFVRVGNDLYFRVDDSLLELVSVFK